MFPDCSPKCSNHSKGTQKNREAHETAQAKRRDCEVGNQKSEPTVTQSDLQCAGTNTYAPAKHHTKSWTVPVASCNYSRH